MTVQIEQLWQRTKELTVELERLEGEIRSLEDAIADDELGTGLLEDDRRSTFLDMRDSYQRRINRNRRRLALLEEERLASLLEFQQTEERLKAIQGRLQAAE